MSTSRADVFYVDDGRPVAPATCKATSGRMRCTLRRRHADAHDFGPDGLVAFDDATPVCGIPDGFEAELACQLGPDHVGGHVFVLPLKGGPPSADALRRMVLLQPARADRCSKRGLNGRCIFPPDHAHPCFLDADEARVGDALAQSLMRGLGLNRNGSKESTS